ncbi:metal-sensitive transcriptional regulator [Nocardioides bruguierae]|uniref:Metal-sensitive transcriptional regulator n=1 Tax=Nocardioides bruguierae TaxID=2945102 RepID=A0A9X2D549_9ACTN|nr:metal-sensitive transcriptional regulator [Nocardioides bruguierae]MCL8026408.1 metal-sensitive transcriptional regulator [Nocardioides bruguierae]MCM0619470.1 metal-sensitive transcriptional regulator [Nocardioides bruguierae]
MQLDPVEIVPVLNRVKRAHGHLAKVVSMMEEGRDCEDIVTQYAAVLKALERAGFALVATGMRQCMAAEANGEEPEMDAAKMEKLFLSLT